LGIYLKIQQTSKLLCPGVKQLGLGKPDFLLRKRNRRPKRKAMTRKTLTTNGKNAYH
jgi:hypothetical protein